MCIANIEMPCSVKQKLYYMHLFHYRNEQIREDYGKKTKWGEKNPWNKQRKKGSEWAWWESYSPGTRTFWFKAVSQTCTSPPPLLLQTHTYTPVLLSKSRCTWRNPSNSKKHKIPNEWVYVCVREKGKERTQMFPCPCLSLSLFFCLLAWWGVWGSVDVCTLLWLVPDVLHWPKSPR